MKNELILIILTLITNANLSAQDSTSLKRNIIFLEILGTGEVYSLNYANLIKSNQSLRIGLSWLPGSWEISGQNDRSFIFIPVEYNYLSGKRNHKLELSAGIKTRWTVYSDLPNSLNFTTVTGAGYRYQRKKGGLFLRAGINLLIPLNLYIDRQELFFYDSLHWLVWPYLSSGFMF